ncbi:hypothetical protein Vadar_001901 [Vaccinium darrowii]|uniref:Uncharacterized protein n=1 Tax=Vaccinium darrowii TaxID=229202 RepID=A0ACB7WX48_9ERIC|nr:hypothetical protein Vadar_001901 [Vaccinium darrowii]
MAANKSKSVILERKETLGMILQISILISSSVKILFFSGQVVKVADFGVARVQTEPGLMTAETGTYRWMAPEGGAAVGKEKRARRKVTSQRWDVREAIVTRISQLADVSRHSKGVITKER